MSLPEEFHRHSRCERPLGLISKGCRGRMGWQGGGGVCPGNTAGPQAGTRGGCPCPGHHLPGDTFPRISRRDPQAQSLPAPSQSRAMQTHTCAPDRAHTGCSVRPGRWQQGGKRRIWGVQTPRSRQKNLTLAGGHGGTYSTDPAQPQLPPAEGKSHFFPDSSINYRAENPSRGNCQHCSSKLQLSWWLHRALQCVTRLASPVPAWHQGHSSAGGVGQGRE